MSAQYIDGDLMMIKWKKDQGGASKFNPQLLLDKINACKSLTSDGRLQFAVDDYYHDSFAAIFSMLQFPDELSDSATKEKIISRSISLLAIKGDINEFDFLAQLNGCAKEILSRPFIEYHLLTSWTLSALIPLRRINIGGCSISILEKYPKKYKSRDMILESEVANYSPDDAYYPKLIVKVKAKSVGVAISKSLDALDFLRAIACWYANYTVEYFGDPYAPINAIRLGRYHTLHDVNGGMIEKTIWHESNFKQARLYHTQHSDVFIRNFRGFISRLKKCKYANKIKGSLVRFVRSLDESDKNIALIKLWGGI